MPRKLPPLGGWRRCPEATWVKDANDHALAYVYGHETFGDADIAKGLTRDEARRIARNIAKLPALLGKK